MTTPDELKKLSETIKNGSEIIKSVYQDVAQLGIRKVGMALETIFDFSNTILLPLKIANERSKIIFINNMERYKTKIEHLDDSDIVTVPPELGIPLIDKLTYTQDYHISEMYLNLLASASSKLTATTTHPSFIRIIENLSPDEAKIILFLTDRFFEKNDIKMKYIYYRVEFTNRRGGSNLTKPLTGIEKFVNLQFKHNIQLYLENFIGLGLLVDKETWTLAESYDDLIELYDDIKEKLDEIKIEEEHKSIEIKKSYYEVTEYGKLFISSCSYHLRNLLIKGHECIQTSKYPEAINCYEELLQIGFPYSIALLNLLELYLISNNIKKYEEVYNDLETTLISKINPITKKYFSVLHSFFTRDFEKMKFEIIECSKIECSEKLKMGTWSFTEILSGLNNYPNDENKTFMLSFIKYLKGEIENTELLNLLNKN